MYILDYNENSTAQYMYKQAVIHTTLSNSLYHITPHDTHDNIGLVSWFQIWRPFSFEGGWRGCNQLKRRVRCFFQKGLLYNI